MQQPDTRPTPRVPFARALRHHAALVAVLLVLGAVGGWLYASTTPTTYTSTTRILVNPSVGNPFSSTPSSVRQDQETSLETEAQMVRSADVLGAVVERSTGLTVRGVSRRLQVSVPPSTQVLEISYSADDPELARQVADAVGEAYLANRDARFKQVQDDRVGRLESQTVRTVEDLRSATTAAQRGTPAQRAFNNELADALRNELVNLRAQRTALENLTAPSGTVVSPANEPSGRRSSPPSCGRSPAASPGSGSGASSPSCSSACAAWSAPRPRYATRASPWWPRCRATTCGSGAPPRSVASSSTPRCGGSGPRCSRWTRDPT